LQYITTGERIGSDRGQEEKAIAIARNMLNDDLPLETIARFTGLTISELEGFANAQLQQLQTQSE
jgi:predicted transposase YdaD